MFDCRCLIALPSLSKNLIFKLKSQTVPMRESIAFEEEQTPFVKTKR